VWKYEVALAEANPPTAQLDSTNGGLEPRKVHLPAPKNTVRLANSPDCASHFVPAITVASRDVHCRVPLPEFFPPVGMLSAGATMCLVCPARGLRPHMASEKSETTHRVVTFLWTAC